MPAEAITKRMAHLHPNPHLKTRESFSQRQILGDTATDQESRFPHLRQLLVF